MTFAFILSSAWDGGWWCYWSISRTNWRLQLTVNSINKRPYIVTILQAGRRNKFLQWRINILFQHVYSRCRISSGWQIVYIIVWVYLPNNNAGSLLILSYYIIALYILCVISLAKSCRLVLFPSFLTLFTACLVTKAQMECNKLYVWAD